MISWNCPYFTALFAKSHRVTALVAAFDKAVIAFPSLAGLRVYTTHSAFSVGYH